MIEFLIIILVLGLLILFAISIFSQNQRHSKHFAKKVNSEFIQERWKSINASASAGGIGLKNAVTEADKLLDYVLLQKGFRGKTMAERLKNAQKRLSDKEAIWQAHKLRNSLAHEVNFDLVASHAKEALDSFQKALRELEVL